MDICVSIIIPCYNAGKYIDETIKSVLKQTFQDFEILIINDGSTDELTLQLLNNSKWNKTKIYHIENCGVASARNYGIKKAIGKFILLLDSDDLIMPTYLEKTTDILNSNKNIKVVTCDVMLFGKINRAYKLPIYTFNKLLGQNIFVVTSLFRKDDFNNTNGFSENMKLGFEDWDFWISLLKTGGEVYKLNEFLFYYRILSNSRNRSISNDTQSQLRYLIYNNHKDTYSKYFLNPIDTFEYQNIINSKEYKLGFLFLKPIRYLYSLFSYEK
jgi:glycosyltransferase involved in cell wall biosynthesis